MPNHDESLTRVLLEQRGMLYGFIDALVRDVNIAEEVFQEVAVVAIRKDNTRNDQEAGEVIRDTVVAILDRGPSKALELKRGKLFLDVAPQAAESPLLVNPGRADQVRVIGTKLTVSRTRSEQTRVAVVSGTAEVGLDDRSVLLVEQTETRVSADEAPLPPRPLDESALWFGLARGLAATYFQNADLTGKSVTRIDPNIDFRWRFAAPDPALDAEQFSARWTGQLQPPVSDDYLFSAFVDDGMRLWIDGQLVIDAWQTTGRRLQFADRPIRLEAGRRYDIKVEYHDARHHAELRLRWQRPSSAQSVIPQSYLFPRK